MTALKTLLVDGTDLQSLTGVIITDWTCLYAPATRRGSHDVIPGSPGQLGAELPLDAYPFAVPVSLEGTDEADLEANLHALSLAIVGTNGLVALSRRMAAVGGGYTTQTANGQFAGFSNFAAPGGLIELEFDLNFVNLDGYWLATSGFTVRVP